MIAPERLNNPETLKRFQREVQAAALLSHPNIVTVFHTDLECPRPYLVMEYVAGTDLQALQKPGPRTFPRPDRGSRTESRGLRARDGDGDLAAGIAYFGEIRMMLASLL